MFTLEFPSYYPVMTYADDRELRGEVYTAYVTRASDQGPNAGKWDNVRTDGTNPRATPRSGAAARLCQLRRALLATKMAESTDQVMKFLRDLAERSDRGANDLDEVRHFAREHHGLTTLEAWDIAYYSEKLRQDQYAISQEDLKPYFPEPRVVAACLPSWTRLYGLEIEAVAGVDTWHPDVAFYRIRDAHGELRGRFYLDLYARAEQARRRLDGRVHRRARHGASGMQMPVAYLTCNFSPPVGRRARAVHPR